MLRTHATARCAALALLIAIASPGCGSDGGDDATIDAATSGASADADAPIDAGSEADAASGLDAAIGTDADPDPEASALGRDCTGFGENSDCPEGFVCVSDEGLGWCTKACAGQADRSCEDGYEGPGFPSCNLQLTLGNDTFQACSVVCSEEAGSEGRLCPEADMCTGDCPGDHLACDSPIRDAQDQTIIGHFCG